MKYLKLVNLRLLSYFDIGCFIIASAAYARTLTGMMRNFNGKAGVLYSLTGFFPFILLLVTGLLCLSGKRKALISAVILSSAMIIVSLGGIVTGGAILIFLDGCESGVYPALDTIYYLSLFIIAGGFVLIIYSLIHIFVLYAALKK